MFSIRRAGDSDGAGILECLRSSFEPYRGSYTPEGFADTVLSPETIGQRLSEMSVFVAVAGAGEIIGTIGCAIARDGEGHIRGMAVLPSWQGRGAASELLRAAEAELRERGCARVSLDTTAPLKRAARFYEKNGYRASGRVADFFGMPLFEYVKHLSSVP
jgi:GNAT superfamily N-acetyltransferase